MKFTEVQIAALAEIFRRLDVSAAYYPTVESKLKAINWAIEEPENVLGLK